MPLIITKAIKEKEKMTIKLDLCNDRSAGYECVQIGLTDQLCIVNE